MTLEGRPGALALRIRSRGSHAGGGPRWWGRLLRSRRKRYQRVAHLSIHDPGIGRGYGHPTIDGERATELFAEAGITLHPTYTAKAAVGFLDALERAGPRPHLFWMTLGEGCRKPLAAKANFRSGPHPLFNNR